MINPPLEVVEAGTVLLFSVDDLMRYHGPGYPGGVAHAYKVLERSLPLLAQGRPPERREIAIETAFAGPGGRDGFELVTRAGTGDRYVVNPGLARAERGATLERYVFVVRHRDVEVTLAIREGFVTDEFIGLARKEGRTGEEEAHLAVLKQEMADRLLARPAVEVYDHVE
ncbi:MAG: hypothetical protein ACRD0M_06635 [Acidimicrobiales bacterium]